MFLNVSLPLLVLNILIQEFNPQFPVYWVQPMDVTIDDHPIFTNRTNHIIDSIIEQIISNIDVITIKIHQLKFISYPNCIIIFEINPDAFMDYKSLKRIRKCLVLLLIGIGDNKLFLHAVSPVRFSKVVAYTTRNDTDAVRVILPDRDLSNFKRSDAPVTFLRYSNYSLLQKLIEETRMNVNGAEFVASMFPKRFSVVEEKDGTFTGFDGEMIKLIANSINSTLKVVPADRSIKYGYKLENGSFNGVLGDVYTWRADIASNAIFIKEYGSPDFLFTIPVQQEELCIAVPSPLLVPNWKIVFRAFEPEVWMLTCFAVLVSMLLWYIMNIIGRTKPHFFDAVFYIGRIIITPVKLPTGPWQRVFTYSVILLSSVMMPSFEGSLLKLLRQRSYEKEIQTLKDFRDSEYTIYTFSSNLIPDTVPQYLTGRVKLYDGLDVGLDLLEITGKYRNLSYLGKKCDILQRSSTSDEVTLVKECPRAYHLGYTMRRGNLLYRAVDRAVSRIMASGLDQAPLISMQCGIKMNKEKEYTTPSPLQLSNMTIALYILKMGYSIAAAIFVLELMIAHIVCGKPLIRKKPREMYAAHKRRHKMYSEMTNDHPLMGTAHDNRALNLSIMNSKNKFISILKMHSYKT